MGFEGEYGAHIRAYVLKAQREAGVPAGFAPAARGPAVAKAGTPAKAGSAPASTGGAGRVLKAATPSMFDICWAGGVPPGHTAMTWARGLEINVSARSGIDGCWSGDVPVSHTEDTWPKQAPAAKKGKKGGGDKAAAKPSAKKPSAKGADKAMDDVARLELRVGQIKKVWEHPDADGLWCEEIDLGGLGVRQIASGLRAHLKKEDMEGKHVVVLANLKAKNLRAFPSHGMVMCAEADSKVRFINPPAGAKVGDLCTFDGQEGDFDEVLPHKPGKNPIEVIFLDLKTDAKGVVVYKGAELKLNGKAIQSELSNGVVK